MDKPQPQESFEEFRQSFFYGRRGDLNFKFFKDLPDDDVASFIQIVLDRLGDAYDTGDVLPLIEAAFEAQVAGYAPDPGTSPKFFFDDGPFTPCEMSVTNARVGLLATSGHFVHGDDPEPFGEAAMTQAEAEARIGEFMSAAPVLSEIPSDTATPALRVRHGGYDIRSAVRDPNVAFPIDRLREARDDGRVGSLAETFFSFPGATAQGRLRKVLPGWVERIHDEDIDVMLLVPV
ncbi:MAG: glycine/sarcosine/betaine reductase selenoprotein B family protein [Actinomycetota bacterium]|nr:glycine/sarcosine/betaine reductase selenoprotein B family protein [Actinomycetota bacterium]MDK1291596.1 glycine/sarcosine/betaine reductase selenoprotein B family protein [Actinomycetota bacterium]